MNKTQIKNEMTQKVADKMPTVDAVTRGYVVDILLDDVVAGRSEAAINQRLTNLANVIAKVL